MVFRSLKKAHEKYYKPCRNVDTIALLFAFHYFWSIVSSLGKMSKF